MASTKSPLSFFSKLILENGRDKLWDKFVPGEEERANSGLSSFDPNTGVKQMIDYNPIDHSAIEYSISFVDHILKPRLVKECRKIRKKLSEKLGNLSIAQQEGALAQLATDLKELYDKTDDTIKNNKEASLVKRYLIYVQNHLSKKYKAQDFIKAPQTNKIPIKSLKPPKLKPGFDREAIIKVLEDIDREMNNGICSSKPSDLLFAIESINTRELKEEFQFICTTQEASYILYKLSKCYKNINIKTIAYSKFFLSNANKEPFTKEDLYTSYHRFTNIEQNRVRTIIDKAFNSVQKQ